MNRIVIIDENGIQYERLGIKMTPSIQDDGGTLKIFIREEDEVLNDEN